MTRASSAIRVPESVRRSFALGLHFYDSGYGGKGLVDKTIKEAKQIVKTGYIKAEKARRMWAWHRRHIVDYRPGWDKKITPGYVANLLWGGDVGRAFVEDLFE